MITILGQFDIHPEDTATASELMRVMMNETMKEQGCDHYAYSRDLSTPDRFQLSELWQDEEALGAQFRADHMATYRAVMATLRVVKRKVKRYNVSEVRDSVLIFV